MNKPVPVTDEQREEMGLARDYTEERNQRVKPFVKGLLARLGQHAFKFASVGKEEATYIDQTIAHLSQRAPTDKALTEEESKKIEETVATLTERREEIIKENDEESASFNSFYEDKFIRQALESNLRVQDISYTFNLTTMAVHMLKSVATTPDKGTELRLQPAALEILEKLGDEPDLMLVVLEGEPQDKGIKRAELYQRLYNELVVPIFDKYEVKYNETQQVFAIMEALIAQVKERVDRTMDGAREIALAKLWGIEDMADLTIAQVHKKCIEKTGE